MKEAGGGGGRSISAWAEISNITFLTAHSVAEVAEEIDDRVTDAQQKGAREQGEELQLPKNEH